MTEEKEDINLYLMELSNEAILAINKKIPNIGLNRLLDIQGILFTFFERIQEEK